MRLSDALIANERYRGEPTTDDEGRTQWPLCVLWDDELQGFGVRIFPPVRGRPSRKDFIVTWKVGLKSRTMAIGTYGADCTLRQARRTAREALDLARRGQDPIEARQRALGIGTAEDLASRFLFEHTAAKKKPAPAPTTDADAEATAGGSPEAEAPAATDAPASDVSASEARGDRGSCGAFDRRRRRVERVTAASGTGGGALAGPGRLGRTASPPAELEPEPEPDTASAAPAAGSSPTASDPTQWRGLRCAAAQRSARRRPCEDRRSSAPDGRRRRRRRNGGRPRYACCRFRTRSIGPSSTAPANRE